MEGETEFSEVKKGLLVYVNCQGLTVLQGGKKWVVCFVFVFCFFLNHSFNFAHFYEGY